MRSNHPFKPHKPQLDARQLIALMVATFALTLLGGLYGPQLAARLMANEPVLQGVDRPADAIYYSSCSAAHAAGVYSIPRSSPAYREEWDGDGDGLACEPHRRRR